MDQTRPGNNFSPFAYHFVSGYLGLLKYVPSYVLPFMNVECTLIWQSYTTFDHIQISFGVKQLMLYISFCITNVIFLLYNINTNIHSIPFIELLQYQYQYCRILFCNANINIDDQIQDFAIPVTTQYQQILQYLDIKIDI